MISSLFQLVMELCAGGSLYDLLCSRGCPLSEIQVRECVASVLLGLDALHSRCSAHQVGQEHTTDRARPIMSSPSAPLSLSMSSPSSLSLSLSLTHTHTHTQIYTLSQL